jgi:hypothetical protein
MELRFCEIDVFDRVKEALEGHSTVTAPAMKVQEGHVKGSVEAITIAPDFKPKGIGGL